MGMLGTWITHISPQGDTRNAEFAEDNQTNYVNGEKKNGMKYSVDLLLPNSRHQAMKALLAQDSRRCPRIIRLFKQLGGYLSGNSQT